MKQPHNVEKQSVCRSSSTTLCLLWPCSSIIFLFLFCVSRPKAELIISCTYWPSVTAVIIKSLVNINQGREQVERYVLRSLTKYESRIAFCKYAAVADPEICPRWSAIARETCGPAWRPFVLIIHIMTRLQKEELKSKIKEQMEMELKDNSDEFINQAN